MPRTVSKIYCAGVALLLAIVLAGIPQAAAIDRQCSDQDNFSLALHGGAIWGQVSLPNKEAFLKTRLEIGRERLASGDRALDVVEAMIAAMEDSGLFNAGKGSIANLDGEVEMDASIMEGEFLRAGAVASIRRLQNPIEAARLVMDDTPHVMMVGEAADEQLSKLGAKQALPSYFLHSGENFSDIVLPKDLAPPEPDPENEGNRSPLAGVWAGSLDGRLNHVIVIDRVTETGADAIVAIGVNEAMGATESFTTQTRAGFLNDFLVVETNWFRIAYRLDDYGRLEALYSTRDGKRSSGLLKRKPELLDKNGTVGAVAMDRCGNLAAGTSTGGFTAKLPGRVGDSPIIGAGTYADNRTAAISATGHGEYFIRHAVAHEISARMRHGGETLIQAAYRVVMKELREAGGGGGIIAVDTQGNVVMLTNTDGMLRGRTTEALSPKVETYFND